MSKPPAFPFYAQDALVGTALMNCEEFGVYMRLLLYQWSHGGLPNCQKSLCSLIGFRRRDVPAIVMGKFKIGEDGMLRNQRMELERDKQVAFRERQLTNGSKGGRPPLTQKEPKNNPVVNPNISPRGLSPQDEEEECILSSSEKGSLRGFEEFWAAYPKKKAKGDAERAWKKLRGPVTLLPQILEAIQKQKRGKDWQKEAGQFIPYPATWLNRQGWLDEGTFLQSPAARVPAPLPAWTPQIDEIKRLLANPDANAVALRKLGNDLPREAWSMLDGITEQNPLRAIMRQQI